MEAKPEATGRFSPLTSSQQGLQPWHFGLFAFMLLPLPIVWFGFYVLHSYWLAALSYGMFACVLPTLLFRSRVEALPESLSLQLWPAHQQPFTKTLLITAIGFGLMLLGWQVLATFIVDWQGLPLHLSTIRCQRSLTLWLFMIYFIVINPIAEEYFWRGIVYNTLKNLWGVSLAAGLTSVFFGGWHWVIIQHFFTPIWQVPLTLMIIFGGLVFTWVHEKTNAMFEPILIHGLGADLPIMIVLWHCLEKAG